MGTWPLNMCLRAQRCYLHLSLPDRREVFQKIRSIGGVCSGVWRRAAIGVLRIVIMTVGIKVYASLANKPTDPTS